MPRLFTGLEIPAEIGQTLSGLRGGLPGARWIDPENYHVTLRFIGDIDGTYANEIASMLFRVNRKPFEVRLQGLTSFGGRKPRAVVAAVEPTRPLIELQAEHERLMQRLIIGQALVGKIGGEIVLRIAVALRPRDPDFLTPVPFTQRGEGMHFNWLRVSDTAERP